MQQNTFLKHVLQRTTLSSGKCHLHCLFSMVINGPNATKTLFKIRTAKTLSYIYQVIHHDTCQGVTFERWWLNQSIWKICERQIKLDNFSKYLQISSKLRSFHHLRVSFVIIPDYFWTMGFKHIPGHHRQALFGFINICGCVNGCEAK